MSNENLKILQVGESWLTESSGGLNRYFYDLFNALSDEHIKVKALVLGSADKLAVPEPELIFFDVPQSSVFSRFLNARKYFIENIKKNDFDLIASHFCLYTMPFIDIIKNKPFLVHFHGPFASESDIESKNLISNKIKYFIEKVVYLKSKKFIVLSQAFKNILVEKYNIPESYIEIIPGGVDTDKFFTGLSKTQARNKFNIASDRPVIVCVRRLVKRMGLENLIDAISVIREKHPDVLLLIAGKGILFETLKEKINYLNLENNVKLLGFVADEDLPALYKAADFSIVPSTALEGFGLVVIESLASGTPVMVTPVGGLPEVIKDFSPELILPSSEKNALIQGVLSVLDGDVKLPDTEQCFDFVRKNYDQKIITKKIYNSYRKFWESKEI